MGRRLGPRFGAEAAFLIAVAIVLGLLEVSWPAIVAGMFAAWLVVAAVELALARRPRAAAAPVDVAPAEPTRTAVDAPEPTAGPADPEPERRPETEPRTELEADGEPEDDADPEPEAEELPPPPPPPVLTAVAAPTEAATPEEPPAHEPEPERSVVELRPGAPREWNLWELERLARERSGDDPVRAEEWSYLLIYLREFASADGSLPRDFDGLVRDSFGDALAAVR